MFFGFDTVTLLTGVAIFFARVADVSMGTMRTIAIVQGRTRIAFVLGFVEVSMWLVVISAVVGRIASHPILGFFYALGFSTGNVVGIRLERWLAMGHIILRVICLKHGRLMADQLRQNGYMVTTFQGEGRSGPVTQLYIVCRRKDLKSILPVINCIEPDVFYVTEPVGMVSKTYRPTMQPPTGWRAVLKKK